MADNINHPKHYTSHPSGVECITIIEHLPFNVGAAIKYLWRAGLKDAANPVEDLQKAAWFVQRETGRLALAGGGKPASSGGGTAAHATAPKRRGRPPKAASVAPVTEGQEAPKKRGRPKGSKNKAKDAAEAVPAAPETLIPPPPPATDAAQG